MGEAEGGVSYAEVEYDSQDIMDNGLGFTHMITSMPTLLAFSRGEAMNPTRVTDPKLMKDREWLKEWIRMEAKRRGSGSGGSAFGGHPSLFGGLFGITK